MGHHGCSLALAVLVLLVPLTTGDDISVVVSKKVFEKRFQGHRYDRWSDFVEAAGEQNNPGGEARLKAGFTLLFAAIATVTVGTVIVYVTSKQVASPFTAWLVVLILLSYAAAVFVYCMATYADPAQRVVTNLLFGLVPWTVSCASYLVAVLLADLCRRFRASISERVAPEEEGWDPDPSLAWLTGGRRDSSVNDLSHRHIGEGMWDLRLALLLAVLPSLGISICFTRTYATGFTGVGTFFDVLALCLFVDVWRLVMHTALLFAPLWTIGRSDGTQTLPGSLKLTFLLCLCWFVALLLMKRHATGVGFTDPIKIHVLACLASYLFFPVSLALAWHCNQTFFKDVLELQSEKLTATWLCMVWVISAMMLLCATVFNATEPNTIGILAMVTSILHAASTFSESVPGCIAMMTISTAVTSLFVFFSVHYAEEVRQAIS